MRILVVTPYFPPEPGACANRIGELSTAWVAEGHEVHVLTGLPCYPDGVVPEGYRGRFLVREHRDGVHVYRAWVWAEPNATAIQRSAYYTSFLAAVPLVGTAVVPEVDVVVTTSPHILAALAGALVARVRARPLVVEIRDVWPKVIWQLGAIPRNHPIIAVLERVEAFLYASATRIVVVTDAFVDEILERATKRDRADIAVIKNGVDPGRWDPATDGRRFRREIGVPDDAFVALYAGNHGAPQGLEVVVDAAGHAPQITWVLVGQGQTKAALQERAAGRSNVVFADPVAPRRMAELYAASDVCLVPLKDLPMFEATIPSKIFEIWAMGRPMVLSLRGEAARLVAEPEAGVVVPPEDPAALAEAVVQLAEDPDRRARIAANGRDFVHAHYDRRVLARRYLDVLTDAVRRGRRRLLRS